MVISIDTDSVVGFIGVGSMGEPMARNIQDAGYELCVYDADAENAAAFDDTATVYDSPQEVAANADVVILMVPDDASVNDVFYGPQGLLQGLEPDMLVINMSTISQGTTILSAESVNEAGGTFLDVPVSGTVGPAEEGTLTILAAGDEEQVEEARSLLETMGSPIVYCGSVGQGTNMKLFINMLLGNMMQAFSESLVFGAAHDLEMGKMQEVIQSGPFDAALFRAKGDMIKNRDFEPQFPVNLLFKDLDLALDAAGEVGVPLPITAATREAAVGARGLGFGEEDMAAIIKFLEETSGTLVNTEDH